MLLLEPSSIVFTGDDVGIESIFAICEIEPNWVMTVELFHCASDERVPLEVSVEPVMCVGVEEKAFGDFVQVQEGRQHMRIGVGRGLSVQETMEQQIYDINDKGHEDRAARAI